jgi:hypothetical protein
VEAASRTAWESILVRRSSSSAVAIDLLYAPSPFGQRVAATAFPGQDIERRLFKNAYAFGWGMMRLAVRPTSHLTTPPPARHTHTHARPNVEFLRTVARPHVRTSFTS